VCGSPVVCNDRGTWLAPGMTWTKDCVTCECLDSGELECTGETCTDCSYYGSNYAAGDTFPGTNCAEECTCQMGGSVTCVQTGPCPSCTYAGRTYESGESFAHDDGCSICSCFSGAIHCNDSGCPLTECDLIQNDYSGEVAVAMSCDPAGGDEQCSEVAIVNLDGGCTVPVTSATKLDERLAAYLAADCVVEPPCLPCPEATRPVCHESGICQWSGG
jgi:hypothetical protein